MSVRLSAFPAIGALLVALVVACSEEAEAPTREESETTSTDEQDERGPWTIDDARAFDEFALYWLGESYQGLPLTEVQWTKYGAQRGSVPENIVFFAYGSCDPSGDGGCAPPVQIQIRPYCDRPPGLLVAVPELTDITIRGATVRPSGGGADLHMWTGDVGISIFTGQRDGAFGVVDALRPIADDGSGELAPLPSPRSESCSRPPPTPDFSSP